MAPARMADETFHIRLAPKSQALTDSLEAEVRALQGLTTHCEAC
jgi:hypothetical protein